MDTEPAWAAAAAGLARAGRVAVDVESDGFHRYPEQVSLIQVAADEGDVYLLDVLAVKDLASLGKLLGDPEVRKVVHAADFDVRSLRRDFGIEIRGLFDTAIAAQFTGATRTGLANVLRDRLGLSLSKPKRLQRLDWSARPLKADALGYAASDVAYLLPLHDDLCAELDRLDRVAWVEEESERLESVSFAPTLPPEEGFLRVTGARDLSPRGRAVLRELYVLREHEAVSAGRPPHWILPVPTLMALAQDPEAGLENGALERLRPGLRRKVRSAVERGLAADPVPWPRPRGRNPWDRPARERLRRLKGWRATEAARLELDVGVVWPMDHLKRVALAPSEDPAALDADHGDVRRWQWRALGASFRRAAAALAEEAP